MQIQSPVTSFRDEKNACRVIQLFLQTFESVPEPNHHSRAPFLNEHKNWDNDAKNSTK